MFDMTRRRFLGTTSAVAAGAAFGGVTRVYGQENKITITTLGGKWEESIRNHFIPLFKERTGAEVDVVLGGPTQWMTQIESQPDDPPLDHIDNSETLAFKLMDEGRAVKLTTDAVPNLADTPGLFHDPWDDHAALYMYAGAGFLYDKDRIKEPPTSWGEFFERAKKGEFKAISLPDISYGWTTAFMWTFADALGGGVDNMDPAFETVRELRPYLAKFWANAGEMERMATTGETDIAVFWDGRSYSMIDGGASHLAFQRPESNVLISSTAAQVVKGGNEKLALEYVNTLLDPVPQLEYFKLINYAVTNSKVEYPEAVRDRILPPEKGVVAPYRELGKMNSQLIERWNQEIRS